MAGQKMWFVEYSRDASNPTIATDRKVVNTQTLHKLERTRWVKILRKEELKDDIAVKMAEKDEWSAFDSEDAFVKESNVVKAVSQDDMKDTPMTIAGVGSGTPVRWIYSTYGKFLSVYGIKNGISMVFNLTSDYDIRHKLSLLKAQVDVGRCDQDDLAELEERIRTLSGLEPDNTSEPSDDVNKKVQVKESTKAGKVDTVYRDGKPVKVKRRGKFTVSSDAQKAAAENARKYAHTEEAEKKRRKSINARGEGKILGEV